AGVPLRTLLLTDYQPALVVQALRACARIQQQAIPHIETLLQLGAMDWRLQRLPDLFVGLLDNQLLMTAEGISDAARATFFSSVPHLRAACDALTACGVPETLEHGDFHDNNIMLKNGAVIINDWGDASISHPFFSLSSLLESAGRNHKLLPDDARAALFTAAYLECWADFAPPAQLEKALALAQIIRPVQFSINYSRLAQNAALQPADYHAGWIAVCLRNFAESVKKPDCLR
ncbi:MAG: aminoglycoside phosphotransferase family protein, partial [Alphaproteobacteria bacterium]|nr:aminoglycoside phosphotransferase family protein [Alphaproteobacteria bacterium]